MTKKKVRMALSGIGRAVEKAAIVFGLAAIAALAAGGDMGNQKLIETTYTVRSGDTLWGIGEEYLAKNTGGRRYILEFIEGIKELNPELVESHGQIHPGQELRINYWIKGGE